MARLILSVAFFSFLLNILLTRLFLLRSGRGGGGSPGGIPRVGGLALWGAFMIVVVCFFWAQGVVPRELLGLIFASTVMFFFGLVDDRHELSVGKKFLVEGLCVLLLLTQGVKTQIVYIGAFANALITCLWVMGITNAFNHLDIMDGLAGGVGLIAAVGFLAVAWFQADATVLFLMSALAGSLAAFLFWNLPPAKIYMGNSGSHWLGFILAASALMPHYAPLNRATALATPLFILGFAVFDTAFLIFMRLLKKRSIFKKSNDHLALRLLQKGYSKTSGLAAILALSVLCALTGVLLTRVSAVAGAILVLAVSAACMTVGAHMSRIHIDG